MTYKDFKEHERLYQVGNEVFFKYHGFIKSGRIVQIIKDFTFSGDIEIWYIIQEPEMKTIANFSANERRIINNKYKVYWDDLYEPTFIGKKLIMDIKTREDTRAYQLVGFDENRHLDSKVWQKFICSI